MQHCNIEESYGVGEKVVMVQMEFSTFELGIEKSGFVDDVNEAGVSVMVYSPLTHGLVSSRYVLSLFGFYSETLI